VQPADLVLVAAATVGLLCGHLLLWRALIFVGFDRWARACSAFQCAGSTRSCSCRSGSPSRCARGRWARCRLFAFSVLPRWRRWR